MDDGRPDAPVLVAVQVAPADSNRRESDEGLVGTALAQISIPPIGPGPGGGENSG